MSLLRQKEAFAMLRRILVPASGSEKDIVGFETAYTKPSSPHDNFAAPAIASRSTRVPLGQP
ncbi:MAG: hypothetical protein ABSB77_10940 [Xanthobacteraceae bacterium]|jgi:hypothetical protein